jgi:hypothetical protein
MERYKEYDYSQGKFIPIHFDKQIIPGTFEHTLHYLIDNEIDLSIFDLRYQNDETGTPAYDPAILLKIILYAYSKGTLFSWHYQPIPSRALQQSPTSSHRQIGKTGKPIKSIQDIKYEKKGLRVFISPKLKADKKFQNITKNASFRLMAGVNR